MSYQKLSMRSLKKDSERIAERAKKPGLMESHEAENPSNKNDASRENKKIIKIESGSKQNLERRPADNLTCKDTMFHGPGPMLFA